MKEAKNDLPRGQRSGILNDGLDQIFWSIILMEIVWYYLSYREKLNKNFDKCVKREMLVQKYI